MFSLLTKKVIALRFTLMLRADKKLSLLFNNRKFFMKEKKNLSMCLTNSETSHDNKKMLNIKECPLRQTIQLRCSSYLDGLWYIKHTEHNWLNKDKLINDNLLCTYTHGYGSVDQPGRTYMYQLFVDTGHLSRNPTMNDGRRQGWMLRDSFGTSHDLMMMMMMMMITMTMMICIHLKRWTFLWGKVIAFFLSF